MLTGAENYVPVQKAISLSIATSISLLGATEADISKVYHTLAQKLHPDKSWRPARRRRRGVGTAAKAVRYSAKTLKHRSRSQLTWYL